MKVKVGLSEVRHLDDGKVALAFDREVKRCVMDCVDRPGETNARTVTLTMTIKPSPDSSGVCEYVNMDMTIQGKTPPRISRTFMGKVSGNGAMEINDASPDDPNQSTLDDLAEEMRGD